MLQIKNSFVLLLVVALYPLIVHSTLRLFAWANSVSVLVIVASVVTVVFGLAAPYIFFPRKSKSAYLIVPVPIIFLVLTALISLLVTGEAFISDFPLEFSAVMVMNTIILFLTVKFINSSKEGANV